MSKLGDFMVRWAFGDLKASAVSTEKTQRFTKEVLRCRDEFILYPAVYEMARCISAVSDCGKTAQVLDIGYNTGRSTAWLTIATGAAIVHAVDVTRKYASVLKQFVCAVDPHTKVHPIQASVSYLPYSENVFDVIFCRSVLQYLDQYVEMGMAIREIRRVLKPQGRGYIIANMAGNPFVNIYRWGTMKQRSVSFGPPRGYISYRMLRNWEGEGWCIPRKEFHIIAPLFYIALDWMPFLQVKHAIYHSIAFADTVLLKVFPFLRRFAWLAFFEIKK